MPPEKYSLFQLEEFLDGGAIDPLLWMAYFPDVLATKVPGCEDCAEFKRQMCPGGSDPVDCFLAK
jgi:hypothetical protein